MAPARKTVSAATPWVSVGIMPAASAVAALRAAPLTSDVVAENSPPPCGNAG